MGRKQPKSDDSDDAGDHSLSVVKKTVLKAAKKRKLFSQEGQER